MGQTYCSEDTCSSATH